MSNPNTFFGATLLYLIEIDLKYRSQFKLTRRCDVVLIDHVLVLLMICKHISGYKISLLHLLLHHVIETNQHKS